MTRCTRLFTFQTIRLILISRYNDTRLFVLYSSSSSPTPSNIPTHIISTFFPSDISSSCITEKFQTLDRQSTSPFFLCCYTLLDSPLLRVTHPTSAWPASCFWRCTSSVTVPREMDGDMLFAVLALGKTLLRAHGTSWTYPVRGDGSFNRRAEAMIRVVTVQRGGRSVGVRPCSWFSPSVTASNRSRAAQESKTRGNAVLKNNK